MRFQRLRRALLAATFLSTLLAACGGGGDVVSKFNPTRLVVFGDALSDTGQRGGVQYTVNSNPVNWTDVVAAAYGLPVAPSSAGGTSYAIGSARVATNPDAQGNAATPSIAQQVSTFLAAGGPQANDLILLQGGIADVIAEVQAEANGLQTSPTTQANVAAAGRALGDQLRRLVGAGAKHVGVTGVYNLGRTPWSTATGRNAQLEDLSNRFNNALLVSIIDFGSTTLYVDSALFFNLVTSAPAAYGFVDVTSTLCTSVDPGVGIGVGPNQVSSPLCTASTVNTALTPATTLYADPVYLTSSSHGLLGNLVASRLRARF